MKRVRSGLETGDFCKFDFAFASPFVAFCVFEYVFDSSVMGDASFDSAHTVMDLESRVVNDGLVCISPVFSRFTR